MARRLLVRGAEVLVTMDGERREIAGGEVLIDGGVIAAVGTALPREGAEVVEAAGCVVTPGLVNTHHHLFQTLTRAVPAAQDAALFGWLRTLYPIWSRMGPEDIRLSARIGLAELALSGCTCSSDHLYVFPNGARLDDSIEAAAEVGIRFHATRGAMSIGESKGGLPPDALVEEEAAILRRQRAGDRRVPRPEAGRDGAGGAGAVLAVLGQPRADARRRHPGAREGGAAAHPPRRERRGHRLFAGELRDAARGLRGERRLDRRGRLARALREAVAGRDRPLRPDRHRGGALPLLERAARQRHRAGAGDARRRRAGRARGRRLGLERLQPPRARGAAGDAGGAASRTARPRWARARRWRSPPAAGRGCSGGATSGRSSRASAPTWCSGTSRTSLLRGSGTRSRRWSSARRSGRGRSTSRGAPWCRTAGLSASTRSGSRRRPGRRSPGWRADGPRSERKTPPIGGGVRSARRCGYRSCSHAKLSTSICFCLILQISFHPLVTFAPRLEPPRPVGSSPYRSRVSIIRAASSAQAARATPSSPG